MCRKFFLLASMVLVIGMTSNASADLVAHWKFDEGSGTSVHEEIGDVNDVITYKSGPVTWATPGGIPGRPLLDNALNFTAADHQYIATSAPHDVSIQDDFSVALWIKPTEYAVPDRQFFGFGGAIALYLRNNKPRWYLRMSNGLVLNEELSTPLPEGTWSHLAFTFALTAGTDETNSAIKIYINGGLAGWHGTLFPAPVDAISSPVIGKHGAADADYFEGILDDVRLYDTALTASEVSDVYNIGLYADPLEASNPNPYYNATGVNITTDLSWTPGSSASYSDVYFGTSFADVNDATDPNTPPGRGRQDASNYDPGVLQFGQTYYWRIDGVKLPDVRKGDVWQFTAGDSIVVDDFEAYGDGDVPGEPGGRIWYTWKDGEGWTVPSPIYGGNGTGSLVSPGTDTARGKQSLAYYYDNDGTNYLGSPDKKYYSEATASVGDLASGADWTLAGLKLLSLQFYGNPDNDANATEQMYLRLKDDEGHAAQIMHGDPSAIRAAAWRVWEIELQDFVQINNALNLAKVNEITIGFGNPDNSTVPGGSGVVYFDEIRLYPSRCVSPPAQGDVNGDCVVDFEDCALIGDSWLESGLWP
jgi:hypothetical protein